MQDVHSYTLVFDRKDPTFLVLETEVSKVDNVNAKMEIKNVCTIIYEFIKQC